MLEQLDTLFIKQKPVGRGDAKRITLMSSIIGEI